MRYCVLWWKFALWFALPHSCLTSQKFLFALDFWPWQQSLKMGWYSHGNGLRSWWCCSAHLDGRLSFFSAPSLHSGGTLTASALCRDLYFVSKLPKPLSVVITGDLSLSAVGHGVLIMSSKKSTKGDILLPTFSSSLLCRVHSLDPFLSVLWDVPSLAGQPTLHPLLPCWAFRFWKFHTKHSSEYVNHISSR